MLPRLFLCALLAATAAAQRLQFLGHELVTREQIDAVEKWLPKALSELAGRSNAWNLRQTADGKHFAWLEINDGKPVSDRGARPLDLVLLDVPGGKPRTRPIRPDVDQPDLLALAPTWVPDGSAVVVGYDLAAPDGKLLARADWVPAAGGDARVLFVETGRIFAVDVSHDGLRIAVLYWRESAAANRPARIVLQLLDRDGVGSRAVEFSYGNVPDGSVAFAPDDRSLAVLVNSQLSIVPVADGETKPAATIVPRVSPVAVPQWAADGKSLLLVGRDAIVHATADGTVQHVWTRADLHGDIAGAGFMPGAGTAVAVAVAVQEYEPPLLEFVRKLGEGPTHLYAAVYELSLADGRARQAPVPPRPIRDRNRDSLPYLPRLAELLAACRR